MLKLTCVCGHVLQGDEIGHSISVSSYNCGVCDVQHARVAFFCPSCRTIFVLMSDPLYNG